MLEVSTDRLKIPFTFKKLLDDAGYTEDEVDVLLYAADGGKGQDARVDYLVKSLKRDLPHYYVLRACSFQAEALAKKAARHDGKEEQVEADKAFKECKNDLDGWIRMLDARVDEVMTLLYVVELEACDKLLPLNELKNQLAR